MNTQQLRVKTSQIEELTEILTRIKSKTTDIFSLIIKIESLKDRFDGEILAIALEEVSQHDP